MVLVGVLLYTLIMEEPILLLLVHQTQELLGLIVLSLNLRQAWQLKRDILFLSLNKSTANKTSLELISRLEIEIEQPMALSVPRMTLHMEPRKYMM